MSLLIGAFTIGVILSLLALGVFVSFRVFEFPDITADGSITLGAAVAAMLLVAQVHPVLATAIACAAGAVAGATTGSDPHAVQHQPAALGHPGDDGALLDQPARHGQEQRAAALGADARDDGGTCGDGCPWRRALQPGWLGGQHARRRRCWSSRCLLPRWPRRSSSSSSARISARRCRRPATTRR